ncbi:MAG: hypothetical protein WDO16_05085 [Bacteroidota bacterium]
MKKLIVLGAFLTFVIISASAQGQRDNVRRERTEKVFDRGQLSRPEKFRQHKDESRFKGEKRKAFRDGKVSHTERRKLHKMKRHNRHHSFRMKHNGHRRGK